MRLELAKALGLAESASEAELLAYAGALAGTVASQAATITSLQGRLNLLESTAAQAADDESQIAEKMAHGLSREQAAAVIRRQRAYDAVQAVPVITAPEATPATNAGAGETSTPQPTPVVES